MPAKPNRSRFSLATNVYRYEVYRGRSLSIDFTFRSDITFRIQYRRKGIVSRAQGKRKKFQFVGFFLIKWFRLLINFVVL